MNKREQLLTFLGCEPHEIDTFKSLLEYPVGISVVMLSRKTGISRPTLYGHLDSLMEKGLVKKYSKEKSALYATQDMTILEEMYDEKLSIYKKSKSELKKLLKQDKNIETSPRFSVHEGTNSFDAIFMDILRSYPEETLWIWPIGKMLNVIPPEQFEYFHSERQKRDIKLKVLWAEDSKVDIAKHPYLLSAKGSHREIRLLPKGISPSVGYGIYGNKVAVISDNQESFGFIVESASFAKTLKSEFEYLWKNSKQYK